MNYYRIKERVERGTRSCRASNTEGTNLGLKGDMEQRIHRKRRRYSSSLSKSTLSFPLDLILEILLKLPAKSVVRFRSVAKLWSSTTTDPYFTNSFETKSSTRPNLLMFFRKRDKLFVFTFPQNHCSSQHVDCYHMTYPKYCCFSFTESVHGLICFRKATKPIIWNPSLRQFLTLSKPEKSWKGITIFLGYDPIERKHKVLCMPRNKTCDECRVLTLGSTQESWRKIKTNHKHRSFYCTHGRCINGVIYYPAYNDQPNVIIIMSFDVRSEKFNMIELPLMDTIGVMLIPYQGRLACFDKNNTNDNDGITLWILEDAKKHKWSCRHFLAPFVHYDPSLKTNFILDGITHAGEFIYVPSTFRNSFYILYFDTKGNSFRKVEFEGIAADGFRLSNGLGNKSMNRLHTFSNHIQSFMSL